MSRSANQITVMYFVIVALFFNTAVSMTVLGSTEQSNKGTLLCTLQGYQWVSFQELGGSAPAPAEHCKICLFPAVDHNIDDYLVRSMLSIVLVVTSASTLLFEHRLFRLGSPYSFAQGRAPPALT